MPIPTFSGSITAELYTPDGRRWFKFGDKVVGDVLVSLGKPRAVGKMTARLRCIEKVRLPFDTDAYSLQSRMDTIQHYDSDELAVADTESYTVAANVHRFPINFSLPSDIKELPTSYGYWYLDGGESRWYGVKWFLELRGSNKTIEYVETPVRVFPKSSPFNFSPLRPPEGNPFVDRSLDSSESNIKRAVSVAQYENCRVRTTMESSSTLHAGEFPHLRVSVQTDLNGALSLFKVVVSLQSRIKLSINNLTTINESSTTLAKWHTDTILKDEIDITSDLLANLREDAIWECDMKSDTTTVKHFIDCSIYFTSAITQRFAKKSSVTSPIKVIPPVDDIPSRESLPTYSA